MTTTRDRLREKLDATRLGMALGVTLSHTDARRLDALVQAVGSADDLLEEYINEWQDAEPRWAAAMQRIRTALAAITQDDAGGKDG
jgi:hypothetical protein